jgi:nucleoside-diphosphate-sugar epimerase
MTERLGVLITGATGFVGRALSLSLSSLPIYRVVSASRATRAVLEGIEHRSHELLDATAIPALEDIEVVIHTAARVHVMNDKASSKLEAYRAANVSGTIELANAAAQAGVKRFIYLSSIKVNGEFTLPGRPFAADDVPDPQDPYGQSKYEAEQALREIETRTAMSVVIIRPPLVYGPGVGANFLEMMKWVARGLPLPLGCINNRRSLVGLENLVDLLRTCIHSPKAGGKTFLVSDGIDLSTTQLLREVGKSLGRQAALLPVPSHLVEILAKALGKGAMAQRLCKSLQVDISYTVETLNWTPPVSVEKALRATCATYLAGAPTDAKSNK